MTRNIMRGGVRPVRAPYKDATTARGICGLNAWVDLLNSWGAKGALTELGWPHEGYYTGGPGWNAWGRDFLRHAQYVGIEVFAFVADPYYGLSERYSIYCQGTGAPDASLYVSSTTAAPFEEAYGRGLRGGVQLAFQEMGHLRKKADGTLMYSNVDPAPTPNMWTIPTTTTMNYLSARKSKIIRTRFAIEYIYPQLYGALDTNMLNIYQGIADRAAAAGLRIVWCLEGEGQYQLGDPVTHAVTQAVMGKGVYTAGHSADFWKKFASVAKNWPATYGYELDNEPHYVVEDGQWSRWEGYTQTICAAIRQVDTSHIIYVPAAYWSAMEAFPQMHTRGPWCNAYEPVRYVTHYYPDLEGGTLNYAEIEAKNLSLGWTVNGK